MTPTAQLLQYDLTPDGKRFPLGAGEGGVSGIL